ncbi:MAG: hypothetical protein ACI392_04685 [Paludibacteraceae bacterium]
MKDLVKQNIPYVVLFLLLVILNVMKVSSFRYGFFTAYDEAYFLLKLQEAYDMSCITGKSQWNLIAIHWFPYLDLTHKAQSYLASAILMWATIVVSTLTACVLYDKKKVCKYLTVITLVFMGLIGGGLSYVPMQTAVLCWALCTFMLFQHSKVGWQKIAYAIICGSCLGLALFIIIPAALILLGCIAVLIVLLYWQDKKKIFSYLGAGVTGVCLVCLYVHFAVCPLSDIVDAMCFTAGYIGKSGYHYDIGSFLMQYGLFFRDCLFVLVVFVGAYWLSTLCKQKYIAGLVYIAILLIYTHYQKKPIVSPSMFMASTFMIPFLFGNRDNYHWKKLLHAKTWYYLFLVAFPLLASFGTNTALSGRMGCFLIAWVFLWLEWDYQNPLDDYRYVRLGAILLFLIPLTNILKTYQQRDDTYHFTRGNQNFAEIAITEKQKAYFDHVYDIMENYHYVPRQSVVFTACYDYCTLYALGAVNSSNFHQIQNFHYFDKDKMLKPDFIFLCKWDSIVIAEELKEMPWGWPEEFDKYYVGTPEPDDAPWIEHVELEKRDLYCRRSLKDKKY